MIECGVGEAVARGLPASIDATVVVACLVGAARARGFGASLRITAAAGVRPARGAQRQSAARSNVQSGSRPRQHG